MQTEKVFVILFIIFFIGMWTFALALNSVMGGWNRLAIRYRIQDGFHGKKIRVKSGRLGTVSYRKVLIFGGNYQGMYLAVNFLFSFWHPPLFIPWDEIKREESQSIFSSYAVLSFAQEPSVKLRIQEKVANKIFSMKMDALF